MTPSPAKRKAQQAEAEEQAKAQAEAEAKAAAAAKIAAVAPKVDNKEVCEYLNPRGTALSRIMFLSSGARARRRLCSTGDLSRRQRRRASLSQKRSQRSGRATSLGMRHVHFNKH